MRGRVREGEGERRREGHKEKDTKKNDQKKREYWRGIKK